MKFNQLSQLLCLLLALAFASHASMYVTSEAKVVSIIGISSDIDNEPSTDLIPQNLWITLVSWVVFLFIRANYLYRFNFTTAFQSGVSIRSPPKTLKLFKI